MNGYLIIQWLRKSFVNLFMMQHTGRCLLLLIVGEWSDQCSVTNSTWLAVRAGCPVAETITGCSGYQLGHTHIEQCQKTGNWLQGVHIPWCRWPESDNFATMAFLSLRFDDLSMGRSKRTWWIIMINDWIRLLNENRCWFFKCCFQWQSLTWYLCGSCLKRQETSQENVRSLKVVVDIISKGQVQQEHRHSSHS